MPNQKVKSQKNAENQILAFKRGHRQRKQERKRKTHGIEKTTDEQMAEQKGGHKEVSRACKKRIFWKNDTKRKVNCCSKANESEGNENWVQEEEDQENKSQAKWWDEKKVRKSFKQKDNKGDETK